MADPAPYWPLFLARENQRVQAAWPQPMVDSPESCLGHVSPYFDCLLHVVNYLEAFSGARMVIFLTLFFGAKIHLPLALRRWCVGLTLVSLAIVVIDLGNLYAWWLD